MHKTFVLTLSVIAATIALPLDVAAATGTPAFGSIWTVDTAGNTLNLYAPGGGTAQLLATVSGASTGLDQPTGVAVDENGTVYVANAGSDSITEYPPDADGNVPPTATIAGAKTALDAPSSISYDGTLLWVTDPASNVVEAFSPDTSGDALPALTISGSRTKLAHPVSVSADPETGSIWVLNTPTTGLPSVETFEGLGDVAPAYRASGSATGLHAPVSIMAQGGIDALVSDSATNSISTFFELVGAPPSIKNEPVSTIKGSNTKLHQPAGLAADASGRTVVTNLGNHTITTYGVNAHGNASPVATLAAVTAPANNLAVFTAPPGAPTDVKVKTTSSSATVSWKPPASTGGGGVHYDAVAIESPKHFSTDFNLNPIERTTRQTSIKFKHLDPNARYGFALAACNNSGCSDSRQASAKTKAAPPSAPLHVAAAAGTTVAQVIWESPNSDGGLPIKKYLVEYAGCNPTKHGCHFKTIAVRAKHHRVKITGLSPGKHYRIAVRARNRLGIGKASHVVRITT